MNDAADFHLKKVPIRPCNTDLYLVEFPKSGITWFSHILVNLFLLQRQSPFRASYFNLELFVGDIHVSRDLVKMEDMPFRMIKSHSKFNPHYRHMVYLLRNPFDVMKSYYRFVTDNGEYDASFGEFIRHPNFGVANYVDHVEGWLKRGNRQLLHLLRYEDLRHDTEETVKRFLRILGYQCNDAIIHEAVALSHIDAMQEDNERYRAHCPFKNYTFVGQGRFSDIHIDDGDAAYIFDTAGDLLREYYDDFEFQR